MRTAATLVVVALALTAGACGGPQEQQFTRADSDAIRKLDADFVAAFNAKNVDKLLTLYADNSVFMPPNAPTLRGREPLTSFYREMMSKSDTSLQMDPVDIAGHGPIAYQNGTFTRTTAGNRDRGKFLFVMRKMGDTWRFEYTIWSSDLPAPASMP